RDERVDDALDVLRDGERQRGGHAAESRKARSLDAEVGALDVGRAEQLLARSGLDDRTGLEDIRAVRDLERLRRVLLDEEDRDALRVDLTDDLEDGLDEDRREAERRLVEHEEL